MPRKKPVVETEKTTTNAPHRQGDIVNRAVIFVSLLVLIGVLFLCWQALRVTEGDEFATIPSSTPSASANTDNSLKLNHTYQRQGAEIKTDPSQVGRAGNPLSAPSK